MNLIVSTPGTTPTLLLSDKTRAGWQSLKTARRILVLSALAAFMVAGGAAMGADKTGNIAGLAKISVSSTREPYVKENAIDGNPDTSWSCALGQTDGQWLQLDWDRPQTMSGVILRQTGPYLIAVDVQVRQGTNWVTVGTAGFANQKPPLIIALPFKPCVSSSLRLSFQGPVALSEVEVHQDARLVEEAANRVSKVDIAVAGDAAGGLIGTVSQEEGARAVEGADVTVSGASGGKMWQRAAKTGENGFFSIGLPPGLGGSIAVSAAKGTVHGQASFESDEIMAVR